MEMTYIIFEIPMIPALDRQAKRRSTSILGKRLFMLIK